MSNDRSELRWGVEQRLKFIEFRLFWEGHVNRSDVMEKFGLSVNQASSDLNRYIGLAPANMTYDKSLRTYVRDSGFTPIFNKLDAGRYLAQLRSLADSIIDSDDTWIAELPSYDAAPTPAEIDAYQRFGLRSSPADAVRRAKQSTASIILADVADAQGDVDAYMARYSAEQLTYGTIAPGVAWRLIEAGRVPEADEIARNAMAREADSPFRRFSSDLDEVYEDCLARLGKLDDLKAHLWSTFAQHLSARALRKYLKLLPDFDDIEAEEKALEIVMGHPRLNVALDFLTLWPSLDRAARLVLARAEVLDGNDYMTLSQAAEALDARHPLAASLLRRAMITDTLSGAKSSRYRHAARHLAECQSADTAISDYGDHPAQGQFVETLRAQHGRKYGFWGLIDG